MANLGNLLAGHHSLNAFFSWSVLLIYILFTVIFSWSALLVFLLLVCPADLSSHGLPCWSFFSWSALLVFCLLVSPADLHSHSLILRGLIFADITIAKIVENKMGCVCQDCHVRLGSVSTSTGSSSWLFHFALVHQKWPTNEKVKQIWLRLTTGTHLVAAFVEQRKNGNRILD